MKLYNLPKRLCYFILCDAADCEASFVFLARILRFNIKKVVGNDRDASKSKELKEKMNLVLYRYAHVLYTHPEKEERRPHYMCIRNASKERPYRNPNCNYGEMIAIDNAYWLGATHDVNGITHMWNDMIRGKVIHDGIQWSERSELRTAEEYKDQLLRHTPAVGIRAVIMSFDIRRQEDQEIYDKRNSGLPFEIKKNINTRGSYFVNHFGLRFAPRADRNERYIQDEYRGKIASEQVRVPYHRERDDGYVPKDFSYMHPGDCDACQRTEDELFGCGSAFLLPTRFIETEILSQIEEVAFVIGGQTVHSFDARTLLEMEIYSRSQHGMSLFWKCSHGSVYLRISDMFCSTRNPWVASFNIGYHSCELVFKCRGRANTDDDTFLFQGFYTSVAPVNYIDHRTMDERDIYIEKRVYTECHDCDCEDKVIQKTHRGMGYNHKGALMNCHRDVDVIVPSSSSSKTGNVDDANHYKMRMRSFSDSTLASLTDAMLCDYKLAPDHLERQKWRIMGKERERELAILEIQTDQIMDHLSYKSLTPVGIMISFSDLQPSIVGGTFMFASDPVSKLIHDRRLAENQPPTVSFDGGDFLHTFKDQYYDVEYQDDGQGGRSFSEVYGDFTDSRSVYYIPLSRWDGAFTDRLCPLTKDCDDKIDWMDNSRMFGNYNQRKPLGSPMCVHLSKLVLFVKRNQTRDATVRVRYIYSNEMYCTDGMGSIRHCFF